MGSDYDAIIIGSGIGGAADSARELFQVIHDARG